jgi:acetate kinase
MFVERVRHAIGALATNLGGLDALVFTDRAGVDSAALRAAVCDGLEFLGLRLDPNRNIAPVPDADVASEESPARILVLQTREEWMVVREARPMLGQKSKAYQ